MRTALYTDGSWITSTRRGGYAVVDSLSACIAAESFIGGTSQRAELMAILVALRHVIVGQYTGARIVTDSQYAHNVLTRQKVATKNLDLVECIWLYLDLFGGAVKLVWKPRNSTPEMRLADKLAKLMAKGG